MFTKLKKLSWFKRNKLENQTQQTKEQENSAFLRKKESTHPSIGLTPELAAQYLLDAERGMLFSQCELAEDMEEKDTHIQSELGKRRRSIQGLNWNILPPPNATDAEIKDTEMLSDMIESFSWFDDCIFDASDAILKGFSCQEFSGWEKCGDLMLPTGIEFRDPSWFQCHPEDKNILTLRDGSYEGAELAPFNWIVHKARSKSGYLSRIGLVRTLVWPFIFKNYSIRDLAEFLEIYGLPIRIGKYPSGATEKERSTLLNAVMQIGHNAGGIIPTGMELDFKNAADGASEPFMAMVNWAEMSISKAILGGTLTSQAGEIGSQALGNVHNEVRFEVRNSDAKQLSATLTRDLILPLYLLNGRSFSDINRHPRFEFDLSEPEDLSYYAQNLPPLIAHGLKVPAEWLREKLQIPVASDDEEILKAQAPEMPAFLSNQLSNQLAQINQVTQKQAILSAQPDPIEVAVSGVSPQDWRQAVDPLLKPAIDLLLSHDLATAKAKIESLYNELDADEVQDIIARGIFVANLWGQISGENSNG